MNTSNFFFPLFLFLLSFNSCKQDDDSVVITPNTSSGSTSVIYDNFENTPLAIVGNPKYNFIVAFERTMADGTILEFEVKQGALPKILTDNEGNTWDIFGRAIEGPRTGSELTKSNAYFGFWFAWSTMYPGVEIYNGEAFSGNYTPEQNANDWTIPTANVISVLSQDAIPAIDQPQFELYDNREFIETGSYFLEDNDIVIGVAIEDDIKLYPHRILNWHEVVNDEINGTEFALSFCPLTATSVLWDRNIDGSSTNFGVSGLLYNSNVIAFDRNTSSLWSQMKQSCINGELISTSMQTQSVLETTWGTWKILLEDLNVLNTNTGFSKDYTINPYTEYLMATSNLSYPVSYTDDRLPLKERVYGVVINEKVKVYQFKDFD